MNYKSISLISGTLLLFTLSANGQKKDSKPNIIFILCDDMGYGAAMEILSLPQSRPRPSAPQ